MGFINPFITGGYHPVSISEVFSAMSLAFDSAADMACHQPISAQGLPLKIKAPFQSPGEILFKIFDCQTVHTGCRQGN